MKKEQNPPRLGGGSIEKPPVPTRSSMNNYSTSSTSQSTLSFPPFTEEVLPSEELGADSCPWLDNYIQFSRKWSPESYAGFHETCGLFVLSTIAARRVAFNLGRTRYTNLYLALVGRTSIHAKTTAAEIAVDVIDKAGLDWFLAPDNSTPQKFIEDMSSTELPVGFPDLNDELRERKILRALTSGQRGWFVDEFGSHVTAMMQGNGVMNSFRSLIRRLDDTPSRYENATISRGNDIVKNPYLTLLVNLTPADLLPYVKEGASLWGDGYLARFALITPPDSSLEFGRFPNEQRVIPESLISPLNRWHQRLGLPEYSIIEEDDKSILLIGPMAPQVLTISPDVYDAFYDYRDALRMIAFNSEIHDLDGNHARFPEKALRVSALFASLGESHQIDLNHWARAQAIAERWRRGLHELYGQVAGSEPKKPLSAEDRVMRAIRLKVSPTKREIVQFTGLGSESVENVLDSLIQVSKVQAKPNGKTTDYVLL